jgi:hypothetical protein
MARATLKRWRGVTQHRRMRASAADAGTLWRQVAQSEQCRAEGAGGAVGGARASGSAGVEQRVRDRAERGTGARTGRQCGSCGVQVG